MAAELVPPPSGISCRTAVKPEPSQRKDNVRSRRRAHVNGADNMRGGQPSDVLAGLLIEASYASRRQEEPDSNNNKNWSQIGIILSTT